MPKFAKSPWFRFVGLVTIGAVIGLDTSDSMQSGVLTALSGACWGAMVALLFELDRPPAYRLPIAAACGGFFFFGSVLGWISTSPTPLGSVLVAAVSALGIAWSVSKI
jgi:hypothetical protein